MLRLVGLLRTAYWLPLFLWLVACVPAEGEPALSGTSTSADESLASAAAAATGPAAITTTAVEAVTTVPTPFPSPTMTPTASCSPLVSSSPPASCPPLVTPTAGPEWPPLPAPSANDQGQAPEVTPTPVPPPPGLVYSLEGRLWRVGEDWQPVALAAEPGDVLSVDSLSVDRFSADGQRALRVVDGDIWLITLPGGQRFNLTGNSGRVHCCPKFWPERPGTIIAGSWPSVDDVGPSTGHLTSATFDLSEYRVLDEQSLSNANAAPGPDGRTIAYDRGGSAWLYDWEEGPRPLDPAEYGLDNIARIAGPSWSPDGRQLAWTVAVTDPEWRIAVAVFDLDEGMARLFHRYQNVGRGGWFLPSVWSPDGRWLAFVAEDADPELFGVWVIDVDSGEEVYIGRGIHPRWSPDGRWLLVNSAEGPNETPWLVETGSWYPLQVYLPSGAQVVDWFP